jgi:hypothetical protein
MPWKMPKRKKIQQKIEEGYRYINKFNDSVCEQTKN